MANAPSKPYKGYGMEGLVAAWYVRQTARDGEEICHTARCIAAYLNSGSRVLEVAPGPGYLAIELARLSGAFVTGLDISRSFVGIARENASKAGVRVDFEHGDAADLPFPDARSISSSAARHSRISPDRSSRSTRCAACSSPAAMRSSSICARISRRAR